jgi:hypothetical protein
VSDFDVLAPPQFVGDSLLERVARAYEEAVDVYGDACDQNAVAENGYLREFALAWAHAVEDKVPATTRAKHCDTQPLVLAARQEWNRAQATERRCREKCRELSERLSAVQSHLRFVREGT